MHIIAHANSNSVHAKQRTVVGDVAQDATVELRRLRCGVQRVVLLLVATCLD